MRLRDRVVMVTGAAGAIGQELCRVFMANGALLAVTDLDGDALAQLADALSTNARKSYVRGVDATDLDAVEDYVADASSMLGAIEVLVNVAGSFEISDFETSTPDQWEEMVAANLRTALVGCRAVVPSMLEAGRGSIVNFASTAGEYGSIRPAAVYAAAKAGVIGFTKSLAREVSPRGVRVNAISPGPVDTPALQAGTSAARSEAAARTLVGRMGTPRDIAEGALYLASDESAFVTGTVLQVNGGSLL